jgi:penicillin-binding protein 1C
MTGGRKRRRIPGRWIAATGFTLTSVMVGGAIQIDRLFPPPLDQAAERSVTVVDREGGLLRAFTIADGRWRLPVTLDEVDPTFLRMLLAYEDRRFHQHPGVDPLALLRAAGQFAANGRIVSGGSTITMQLARLIEPRESRSVAAKLQQMARALQIERRLTKRQILERYLTLAPYGGNVEGVRAAALAYFGREPGNLRVGEAALLVALPQLPESRRPDRDPTAAGRARDRVLERMAAAGVIPGADARMAARRPVRSTRFALPAHAPHLARDLARASPGVARHETTIDRRLQAGLEAVAREQAVSLGEKLSVALLLADQSTGEILARVGSADFFDETRTGSVDMTRAVRSPGSALKPFIYALAFDGGLAHPETLINDRPADFAGYRPQNFDMSYQGTVTVREALQMSLNVPAVAALEAVGAMRLVSAFRKAGIRPRLPRDERPGLAIALGGVGITLQDLVTLYTALPLGGAAVMLRDQPAAEDSVAGTARLFGETAAWYVTRILAGTPPPAHASRTGIAYKTGTSYGFRDAWAVGYDGRHVLGVWVGRPDTTAVPGLTGRSAAAPILFEAFARLPGARSPLRGTPAGALQASTGELPVGLRRFEMPGRAGSGRHARIKPPAITYPPDGARVELAGAGQAAQERPLALKVQGGLPPFNWLANGTPVTGPERGRSVHWLPRGKGYFTVTVIDAAGRTDKVSFYLQ